MEEIQDRATDPADLADLAQGDAAQELADTGESALAAALRRAREEDGELRAGHQSYNKHSSNPW
ncbi:hypothetical protein [Dactylosporangium sp. NPDC005555]|uniref:hypothetical protein n=1 Tax=Dactylosporangium sp. NPDC005555 TaxID=3154889 RepID=UPI0033B6F3D5